MMKKLLKNQRGISAIEIVLILVIVGLVGFVGWKVYDARQSVNNQKLVDSNPKTSEKLEPVTDAEKAKEAEEDSSAATGEKESSPPAEQKAKTECKNGTKQGENCTFTFEAKEVPARFQAYSVQVSPSLTQLYGEITFTATCSVEGACKKFNTEEVVTTESRGGGLDWKIDGDTSITVSVGNTITTGGVPQQKYEFNQFIYTHEPNPVCTANQWYCYGLRVEYDRKQ